MFTVLTERNSMVDEPVNLDLLAIGAYEPHNQLSRETLDTQVSRVATSTNMNTTFDNLPMTMQCPNCRTVIIKVNKITQTFFEGTSHLDPAATPFIGKTEHRCIDTINQETVFTHRIELTNPKAGPPIKFTIGTTAILRNYPHDWCSSARVTVDVELEPNTT